MTQTRAAAKREKENDENYIHTQLPDGSQPVVPNTGDNPVENREDGSLKEKPEFIFNEYYIITQGQDATEDPEISVSLGEIVKVLGKHDEQWMKIEHKSKEGLIPKNCLGYIANYIIQEYNAVKPDEISVNKGDRVKVVAIAKNNNERIKIKSGHKEGFIPRTHLGSIPKELKRQSNQALPIALNPLPWISSIVALAGILLFFYNYKSGLYSNRDNHQCNFECEVNKMEKKFKNQSDEFWITLQSCLEGASSKNHPCTLILMNPGERNIDCLLNDIGSASSRLLSGKNSSITTLRGSKLKYEDFSFEKCKSDLKEYKVMLISDMESIPGGVLEQFHSLCDRYDPAVKQAVIVFTLNYNSIKLNNIGGMNDNTLANNLMMELWQNSIHHDIINAIIVRLSENAVRINPIVC